MTEDITTRPGNSTIFLDLTTVEDVTTVRANTKGPATPENPRPPWVPVAETDRFVLRIRETIQLVADPVGNLTFVELDLYKERFDAQDPDIEDTLKQRRFFTVTRDSAPFEMELVTDRASRPDVRLSWTSPHFITIKHIPKSGPTGEEFHASFRFSVKLKDENGVEYCWDPDVHDIGD